jgi:HK97 family phage major capsid protein
MEKKTLTVSRKFQRAIIVGAENVCREAAAPDAEEKRVLEFAIASETEDVERWFGVEILDHSAGAVRLDRFQAGAPFLVDHDTRDLVGVIERAYLEARRLWVRVRFGDSPRAREIWNDIITGIRPNVSLAYAVHGMRLEEQTGHADQTVSRYRVTDWEPLEGSTVAIPADISVGPGRSADETTTIEIETPEPERSETMTRRFDAPTEGAPAGGAAVPSVPAVTVAAPDNRAAEMLAMGRRHGEIELAARFVETGKSPAELSAAILEARNPGLSLSVVNDSPIIGLTDRDVGRFSILRLVDALSNPSDRSAQESAAFEFECSRAVAGAMRKTPKGSYIPLDVLEARSIRTGPKERAMLVGTDSAGGAFKATNLDSASFIDLLRARMVLVQLGARVLGGLTGDLAVPKQTGGATAYWVNENVDVTGSTPTTGQVALAPKTVGAYMDLSRKFVKQTSIEAESFARNDLSAVLALAQDAAGICGPGTGGAPLGIIYTSGIGSVAGGTNGLAPAFSHVVGLETEVSVDNADMGALAYLTNAKARGKMKQVPEHATATMAGFLWTKGDRPGVGMVNGYPAYVTNQVPSNLVKASSGAVCSAIIFGNWADLIIGNWGTIDLTVDPYTLGKSGAVRVVAFLDTDIAVRRAESFAAMLDALTT